MDLEKNSMTALAEKLAVLGGTGPLKQREWRIRCRLGWHDKASSAVRHMLHRERLPSLDEAKEIEAHTSGIAQKGLRPMRGRMSLSFPPCEPLLPRWKRATRSFTSRTLKRCAKCCFSAGLRLLSMADKIEGRTHDAGKSVRLGAAEDHGQS